MRCFASTQLLLRVVLSLSLMLPLLAQAAPAGGWRLLTARDGIIVYRQFSQQTQMETFRGVMRMKLPDEYAMLALYNDVDAFPRWLHLINGASEINRDSPLDRNLRFQINLPWPVKDREAIVNTQLEQVTRPDEESVTAFMKARPELVEKDDDFVRIPELNGIFKLERVEPELVEVTFQVSLDMAGWIPVWVVNYALRDMPYYTLQNLRQIVREKQYQNRYYSYLDLVGPGRPDSAPPAKSWVYGTADESRTAGADTGAQPAEPESPEDASPIAASDRPFLN